MSSWFNDDGTWHLMEASWTNGHHFTAKAACGLEAEWNRMSIDRLPGGGEDVCPDCAPTVVAAPTPKRKSRAKKG